MVFLATLGLLVLIGTPARGKRLLLSMATATALILGSFAIIGLVTAGTSIDERSFWRSVSQPLALIVCVAALVAVVLGIARRRIIAQTLVISVIPWSVITLRELRLQDVWTALALIGIACALVGFGAALPTVFKRVSPRAAESDVMPRELPVDGA